MTASDLAYRAEADGASLPLPDVSPSLAARAQTLLSGVVASAHEHPVRLPEPLTAETWQTHMGAQRDELATTELQRSGLDLVVATCFSQGSQDFVLHWARSMQEQVAAEPDMRFVADRRGLGADGVAVLLGLEDLGTVNDLRDVDDLIDAGIASVGVAYNFGSLLGHGMSEPEDTGLTAFGHEVIQHLNARGVLVDVSHAGHRTSLESIAASTRPVVVNHAGAAGLWPSPRMVEDDVIIAAAESGGFIGIEAAPGSTRTRPDSGEHTVEDIVRHIEYCAELVGPAGVALGGDTFYGDHVGLYCALGSSGAVLPTGAVAFTGERVPGADHPGELARQVCYRLLLAGWSDADISLVLGGNVIRVLDAVFAGVRE